MDITVPLPPLFRMSLVPFSRSKLAGDIKWEMSDLWRVTRKKGHSAFPGFGLAYLHSRTSHKPLCMLFKT